MGSKKNSLRISSRINQKKRIILGLMFATAILLILPNFTTFTVAGEDGEFEHLFVRYTPEGNVVTYWVSAQREGVRTVPNARQLFNKGLLDKLPEPPIDSGIDLDPSTDPPTVDIPFSGRNRVIYATNRNSGKRFIESGGWAIIKDESGKLIAPIGDEMKSWAKVKVPTMAFKGKRIVNLPSGSTIFYRVLLNGNKVGEKTMSWEEYQIKEGCVTRTVEFTDSDGNPKTCTTEMARCRNSVGLGTIYWTTTGAINNVKIEAGFRTDRSEKITDGYSLSYSGVSGSEFDEIALDRIERILGGESREENSISEEDVDRIKEDLTEEEETISDTVIVEDEDLVTDISKESYLDNVLFRGITVFHFLIGTLLLLLILFIIL